MAYIKKIRNYFFGTFTKNTNGRETGFKNTDQPNQERFEELMASAVFFKETGDRAKQYSGTEIDEDLVGHVQIAPDTEAKAGTSGLASLNTTKVVHAGQLPTNEPVTDTLRSYNGNVFSIIADVATATRNKFQHKFDSSFVTWLIARLLPEISGGDANKVVSVNAGETAYELTTPSAGGATTLESLTDVTLSTPAIGDIMYRATLAGGAADWVNLPASTSGNLLQTNGAGTAPTWVTPGSSSTSEGSVLANTLEVIDNDSTAITITLTETVDIYYIKTGKHITIYYSFLLSDATLDANYTTAVDGRGIFIDLTNAALLPDFTTIPFYTGVCETKTVEADMTAFSPHASVYIKEALGIGANETGLVIRPYSVSGNLVGSTALGSTYYRAANDTLIFTGSITYKSVN